MILFHQLAAQSLGLFHTDLKSADILFECGPMTAGELGKKTGLSTGSVTALIDRLEQAGYVKRENDPTDRRRVIILPIKESSQHIKKLFSSLSDSTTTLCKEYTPEELEIIFGFLKKSTDLLDAEIDRIKK
jgi:DNA-binding MarR family transcriptional regulator